MNGEPAPAPNSIDQERRASLRANFRYVFYAMAGSVLAGVTLPVLLVCWHKSTGAQTPLFGDDFDKVPSLLESVVSLEFIATIFCGPGAIVLSALLFKYLSYGKENYSVDNLVKTGMCGGAAMAFLNFPGYLAGAVLGDSGIIVFIRMFLLFAVAGATCGAWTGWQVYRSEHRGAPFWPRYRLSTLLGLVIAWAVLLAIFAPSSHS